MPHRLNVFMALVLIGLLWPVLALVALLIQMTSPGNVLYKGVRMGRDGKPFSILKFRTMYDSLENPGAGITGARDSRVTPFGRLLRKTKIDELPQLWNIVRGDMNFVGPRPEDPRYLSYYSEQQKTVLNIRPGITSFASVAFRNEEDLLEGDDKERDYTEKILPAKLKLELDYIEKRSVRIDLFVIGQTVLALFKR